MNNEEKKDFNELGRILSGEIKSAPDTGVDKELADIWKLAGAYNYSESANTADAWNDIKGKLASPMKVSWLRRNAVSVAASVAILAMAGAGMWLYKSTNTPSLSPGYTVSTGNAETHSLKLADGSTITLNSNSKIVVKEGFNESTRSIILVGQANFEIAKNEQLPFEVTAGPTHTKVLGTGFDIMAYPGEEIKILVKHGKVSFYSNPEHKLFLTHGQGANYDATTGRLESLNAETYAAWCQQDNWVFKKTKLSDIAVMFEHRFGKKMKFDVKNADRLFTGKFDSKASADEIVSTLKLALEIEITIE